MGLQQRINAFAKLGDFLSVFINKPNINANTIENYESFFKDFSHQLKLASNNNGWFTRENVLFSIENWAKILTKENIEDWISSYSFQNITPKNIALIMAGNIPLVGFHDFLCTLVIGHNVLVKQSSNDQHLLPYLAKFLEWVEPEFKGKITFTNDKLSNFDAIIATGSNNTARYFEYYFKNKPSIIRKNRNSVAILTGNETNQQLEALSQDIFRYFGLGCRNVSKLYVPKNYNFDALFNAFYYWHPIINHHKYANNYDYNKAVYLMSAFNILDNGFFILKEETEFASPIATCFYEYYNDKVQLTNSINQNKALLQCIVANGFINNEVAFGTTQTPNLDDYADNIDTVDFLLKL